MKIDTSRFGIVDIEPDDLLHFASGLLGLEECRHWVLLADAVNEALGWLQSATRPEISPPQHRVPAPPHSHDAPLRSP